MKVVSFKQLEVWQDGMALAKHVYAITQSFPKEEGYCLTSQIRRAAISVPSNIAEGKGNDYLKSYLRHISTALGSLAELETQLILANDIGYIALAKDAELTELLDRTGRKLKQLQKRLKQALTPEHRSPNTDRRGIPCAS